MKYIIEFEGVEDLRVETESGSNEVELTMLDWDGKESTYRLPKDKTDMLVRMLQTGARKSSVGKVQTAKAVTLKPRQPRTKNTKK